MSATGQAITGMAPRTGFRNWLGAGRDQDLPRFMQPFSEEDIERAQADPATREQVRELFAWVQFAHDIAKPGSTPHEPGSGIELVRGEGELIIAGYKRITNFRSDEQAVKKYGAFYHGVYESSDDLLINVFPDRTDPNSSLVQIARTVTEEAHHWVGPDRKSQQTIPASSADMQAAIDAVANAGHPNAVYA